MQTGTPEKEHEDNGRTTVRMTVDRRERGTKPFEQLRNASWVELHEEQLKAGDYIVRNRLLIERKSATDLIQSIITNRLFQQCRRLRTADQPCFLLIEGNPYTVGRDMHPEAIRGALISIAVFWCIPILFSDGPGDTVRMLRMITEQHDRNTSYLNQRSFMRKRNLRNRQIHLLQGLPGIGAKRAKQLLQRFGTARRVLDADKEQLTGVKGIGEKTAKKITRVLDAEWNPTPGDE
jgi:Fanconi anemia group M protein